MMGKKDNDDHGMTGHDIAKIIALYLQDRDDVAATWVHNALVGLRTQGGEVYSFEVKRT